MMITIALQTDSKKSYPTMVITCLQTGSKKSYPTMIITWQCRY